MFVSPQHVIDSIGINVLVQFASGKFAEVGSYPNKTDVELALTGAASSELQQQLARWYQSAVQNVNAIINGYVARFSLTQAQISQSVLPAIACDLLYFELAPNSGDEDIKSRKHFAMSQLDKVGKGVIQLTNHNTQTVARTALRTKKAGTQFNWGGY